MKHLIVKVLNAWHLSRYKAHRKAMFDCDAWACMPAKAYHHSRAAYHESRVLP